MILGLHLLSFIDSSPALNLLAELGIFFVMFHTGKVVGCGLGTSLFNYNPWESAIIGAGMNARGAVELVIATVVINLSDELIRTKLIDIPLLTEKQFSGLVLTAFIITTLMAHLFLKWMINKTCVDSDKAAICFL